MKTCIGVISIFALLYIPQQSRTQSINKITGPLGLYRLAIGYSYKDSLGIDSLPMHDLFKFGEWGIVNSNTDYGLPFHLAIDSCLHWNPNRVFGIIVPPSEGGVYNAPGDTALYFPYRRPGPGMIQGGMRFSRLSKLFGPFCGVYIDDFNGDTSIARKVRDAVRGKYIDEEGNVHTNSIAHTPHNKLLVVKYNTSPQPSWMPVIDGISYWRWYNQNTAYLNIDKDIDSLRKHFPGKEIQIGIYVIKGYGNWFAWASPASFQYMVRRAINRYDDGDINGITLFEGFALVKPNTSLEIWNEYSFVPNLDSLYYPFLGLGVGKVTDCETNNPLTNVFLRMYCIGRDSGDTLMRSRQLTDTLGQYQTGLWAGNRTTDSTYYWLIAEKPGYISDTIDFWIKRNSTTFIKTLLLCQTIISVNSFLADNNDITLFPNPTTGKFSLEVQGKQITINKVEIYNMLGERIYSGSGFHHGISNEIDLSTFPKGIYCVIVYIGGTNFHRKVVIR